MAFVGNLFSCGRSRKPQIRDETNSGEDATHSDVTSDPALGGDIRATSNSGPDDRHAKTPLSGRATPAPFPDEEDERPDSRESKRLNDNITPTSCASSDARAVGDFGDTPKDLPHSGNEHSEGPIDDNVKTGKPWKIEQHILVTTRLDTRDSSSVLEATTVPELQDTRPVSVATTSSLQAQETTLARQDPDSKDSDTESLEHPVIIQDVAPTSSTHEDEEKDGNEPEDKDEDEHEHDDEHDDEHDAKVMDASPLQEVVESVARHEEEECVEVGNPTPVAPMTLLNLPAEIRNAIYERMAEENPIRMCRHDDPALVRSDNEKARDCKRHFYSFTQSSRQLRKEFLPVYKEKTEYIIDLWAQKANLTKLASLTGNIMLDIDAACFDLEPINLLPLIRYLARTRRTNIRFGSTDGVVFHSIESIVQQLNKLLPSQGNNDKWLEAVNGPMKRIDLHLFPHEDIRQYYRFRGAEPMLRIVYPSAATESWMKQSHKSGGEYEAYLEKTGLDALEMHVVVGHTSRRTTNEGRLPLDWRLSYVGSRLSLEQAVRISGQWTR